MNIVFMGTPDFAKDSLEAIYEKGHNISAVITVPDKAKGRGMKVIYSPVKEYAIEKGLKMLTTVWIIQIISAVLLIILVFLGIIFLKLLGI